MYWWQWWIFHQVFTSFTKRCGPGSSSYFSGKSHGQACQESWLGDYSNFSGLFKFRIYEKTMGTGKLAAKDNEVFVFSFVWMTYWAYCVVMLFGLNKTQGKHSDSGQSSFKFENKYVSLNNHVRLWTEKDLVGLSMNPRASRNQFFSASAVLLFR